jgi:hypothetical protein
MTRYLLTAALTLIWLFAKAQITEIPARYYLSTPDYVNGNLSEENVIIEVKDMGPKYIRFKDILNAETRKKSKPGSAAWAIVYEDQLYVNMTYAYEIGAPGIFIKPDIIGHYMLIVFDDETFGAFEKERAIYFGAGLTGYAMYKSVIAGGNFVDANGNKRKIIFINRDYHIADGYKLTKNSQALLLDRSIMVDLLKKNKVQRKPGEFTYEEIVGLINELNMKYK